MLGDAFKSVFGACWWSIVSHVEYETLLSISSIIGISHLFMMGYTKLYRDDNETIETEETVKELVHYRELLVQKREYLNLVYKELEVLSDNIAKIKDSF